MIKLMPREQKGEDLPEPVQGLRLVNESVAQLDLEVEMEAGVLEVKVVGIYLGKTVEAPYQEAPPRWKLG